MNYFQQRTNANFNHSCGDCRFLRRLPLIFIRPYLLADTFHYVSRYVSDSLLDMRLL